jgi:hypothetical protein
MLHVPTFSQFRQRWFVCARCETEGYVPWLQKCELCRACKKDIAKRVVALHREHVAERAANELKAFYHFILCRRIPIRARQLVAVFFRTASWSSMDVPTPTLRVTIQARPLPERQIIIRTNRYEYNMYVGERATVIGESGLWWKLDNGKCVPKNQCGKKWDWITSLDFKALTFVSRRWRAILESTLEKKVCAAKEATYHAATIAHAATLAAWKALD